MSRIEYIKNTNATGISVGTGVGLFAGSVYRVNRDILVEELVYYYASSDLAFQPAIYDFTSTSNPILIASGKEVASIGTTTQEVVMKLDSPVLLKNGTPYLMGVKLTQGSVVSHGYGAMPNKYFSNPAFEEYLSLGLVDGRWTISSTGTVTYTHSNYSVLMGIGVRLYDKPELIVEKAPKSEYMPLDFRYKIKDLDSQLSKFEIKLNGLIQNTSQEVDYEGYNRFSLSQAQWNALPFGEHSLTMNMTDVESRIIERIINFVKTTGLSKDVILTDEKWDALNYKKNHTLALEVTDEYDSVVTVESNFVKNLDSSSSFMDIAKASKDSMDEIDKIKSLIVEAIKAKDSTIVFDSKSWQEIIEKTNSITLGKKYAQGTGKITNYKMDVDISKLNFEVGVVLFVANTNRYIYDISYSTTTTRGIGFTNGYSTTLTNNLLSVNLGSLDQLVFSYIAYEK